MSDRGNGGHEVLYEQGKTFYYESLSTFYVSAITLAVFSLALIVTYLITKMTCFFILELLILPLGIPIVYVIHKRYRHKLIIYEDGIRFKSDYIPYLKFSEMDHIESDDKRPRGPYFDILMKENRSKRYRIAKRGMKHADEELGSEFDRIKGFILTRLQTVNPKEERRYLDRGSRAITWKKDALVALNRLDPHRSLHVEMEVTDLLLREGKDVMTLEDYERLEKVALMMID